MHIGMLSNGRISTPDYRSLQMLKTVPATTGASNLKGLSRAEPSAGLDVNASNPLGLKRQGTVLMLCYAFPPIAASGVVRSVAFAKRLPALGWQPSILTVQR